MKNKTSNQVHELRKVGHKVRITHYRRYEGITDKFETKIKTWSRREYDANKSMFALSRMLITGGKTTAEVTLTDGTALSGVAECSEIDGYNRRVGVAAALGRALVSISKNTVSK